MHIWAVRTDGIVDTAAPIRVPPLLVQPVLLLGALRILALVKVLRHLKERDPVRKATPQSKIESTNAGVRICKDTELEMLLPAADPGDSLEAVLDFCIVGEIPIKNVVRKPTKKSPRGVVKVCIISLVVIRILPEARRVIEREIVFLEAIYFGNHSRVDLVDYVCSGGESQELAVGAMLRIFLEGLSILVGVSTFDCSLRPFHALATSNVGRVSTWLLAVPLVVLRLLVHREYL